MCFFGCVTRFSLGKKTRRILPTAKLLLCARMRVEKMTLDVDFFAYFKNFV